MNQVITHTIPAFVVRNSPKILGSMAIAGVATTAIFAARAAPMARDIIDREEDRQREKLENGEQTEFQLGFFEQVKLVWKLYIPTVISALGTVASFVLSQDIVLRRNMAVIGAYTALQDNLEVYKKKVLEEVGERKALAITDSIAADQVVASPPQRDRIVFTGGGETLILDAWSGRYFRSSLELVHKAENRLNQRIIHEGWISLSEFYSEIGLDSTTASDDLGWTTDHLIEIITTATITPDEEPCLVIGFRDDPQFGAWYGH